LLARNEALIFQPEVFEQAQGENTANRRKRVPGREKALFNRFFGWFSIK
jgi:hypothetical protein